MWQWLCGNHASKALAILVAGGEAVRVATGGHKRAVKGVLRMLNQRGHIQLEWATVPDVLNSLELEAEEQKHLLQNILNIRYDKRCITLQ